MSKQCSFLTIVYITYCCLLFFFKWLKWMTGKWKQWSHRALWTEYNRVKMRTIWRPKCGQCLAHNATHTSGQVLTNKTPHTDSDVKASPFKGLSHRDLHSLGMKPLEWPLFSPAHISCDITLKGGQFLFNVSLFIQAPSLNTHKCYQKDITSLDCDNT